MRDRYTLTPEQAEVYKSLVSRQVSIKEMLQNAEQSFIENETKRRLEAGKFFVQMAAHLGSDLTELGKNGKTVAVELEKGGYFAIVTEIPKQGVRNDNSNSKK